MDRYGKYEGTGAFKNEKIRKESPYYDWYLFNEKALKADSMYSQWANPSLATLNKASESYRRFAFKDDDSVMKYWLDFGTGGWRMDVAPWVPDDFWREWRSEIKKKDPNALLICETWFDSSKYFLGDTFDSTMNYIFRQAALELAKGKSIAKVTDTLEMMREYYPEEAFYSLMNLLSTHDATRLLFELGYKGEGKDTEEKIAEAKRRLLAAVFLQMTYPGAPAIYYGDEVGVTGGDDPKNRRSYPWVEDGGKPDLKLLEEFKKLTKLRNNNEILRRGTLKMIDAGEGILAFERHYNGKTALVFINNTVKEIKVNLPSKQPVIRELIEGREFTNTGGLFVPPLYGKVIEFDGR
jgi:glycosidase